MQKQTFSPEEWDSINAALTKQIAEAYPDIKVTPYKVGTAADTSTDTTKEQ